MMKAMIGCGLALVGATSPSGALRLEFHLPEPRGVVRLGVYESREAYEAGRAIREAVVAASGPVVALELPALAPGQYAVKAFLDTNDDGRMDANLFGQPIEPVGFSNDAPPRRGAPPWDAVRFELGPQGAAQTITLK